MDAALWMGGWIKKSQGGVGYKRNVDENELDRGRWQWFDLIASALLTLPPFLVAPPPPPSPLVSSNDGKGKEGRWQLWQDQLEIVANQRRAEVISATCKPALLQLI